MPTYLHLYPNWTHFRWDDDAVQPLLHRVLHLQGKLLGRVEMLGFGLQAAFIS